MALRPGDGQYTHIQIERQPEERERRKRQPFFPRVPVPPDRRGHATELAKQAGDPIEKTVRQRQALGVDPNRLLVLEFNTVNYDTHNDFIERFRTQVVDESIAEEEEQTLVRTVVQFPTDTAVQRFRREITAYQGEPVSGAVLTPRGREKFFDSLQRVGGVSPEDRTGRRIKQEGFPDADRFFLDVDLWRPDDEARAREVLAGFRAICEGAGCRVTDEVRTQSLLLLKVEATREFAEQLLGLDLIARVDLPPRVAAGYARFFEDIRPLDQTQQPEEDDPLMCVVDSGVLSGHPLLREWIVAEETLTQAKTGAHETSRETDCCRGQTDAGRSGGVRSSDIGLQTIIRNVQNCSVSRAADLRRNSLLKNNLGPVRVFGHYDIVLANDSQHEGRFSPA